MSSDLDRFIEVVVTDPDRWPALVGCRDREVFCAEVARAARSVGLSVTPEAVESRLVAARRAWFERCV